MVEIPTEDYKSLMDDPLRYCSEKDILDKLEGFIEEYDSDKIYAGKVIERGE